jgi:cytochrome b6-f complex iron-sulfur subunit
VKEEKPKLSRHDFIKRTWKILGVIAGVEVAALSINLLSPKKDDDSKKKILDAGSVNDFPNNSVTPFRQGQFYLVRRDDGGFLAVSIKCSHLGCSIAWNESENKFICPCHSSSFDINGEVLHPPAPRALDIYEISIDNGIIRVQLNKKQRRSSFAKSQITYA